MSCVRYGKAREVTRGEWMAYRRRLGRQIRDARLELDVSRKHLADMIGMSSSTVVRVEEASRNVTIEVLFRIASGLGISLHEILP